MTGSVATHTGRGWMGGLVLRMVLAFIVAELGRTMTQTAIFKLFVKKKKSLASQRDIYICYTIYEFVSVVSICPEGMLCLPLSLSFFYIL